MYERMLEQTNWYFSWIDIFPGRNNCTLVIPSDFKSDKNQKIMFFDDINLYF